MIVNGKRVKKKTLRDKNTHKSTVIRVVAKPGSPGRGWVLHAGRAIPVALGPAGIRRDKREGDGATPAGTWRPRQLRWRTDHGLCPATRLSARPIRRTDGWCDDPLSRRYNCPVTLPFAASHEDMWRKDALYDLVVVLDHNARPRKARRGSAVFLHLAREGFQPTAGCIAFRRADLKRLLAKMTRHTRIKIG